MAKDFRGRKVYVKKAVPPPTEERRSKKNSRNTGPKPGLRRRRKGIQLLRLAKEEEVSGETKNQVEGGVTPRTPDQRGQADPQARVPLEGVLNRPFPLFITNL